MHAIARSVHIGTYIAGVDPRLGSVETEYSPIPRTIPRGKEFWLA